MGRGKDKGTRIRVELGKSISHNQASKDDSSILSSKQAQISPVPIDMVLIARDQQAPVRGYKAKRSQHILYALLRHQPANTEEIAARSKCHVATEGGRARGFPHGDAVSDHRRCSSSVSLDDLGIAPRNGDDRIRIPARELLRKAQKCSCDASPLRMLVVWAVIGKNRAHPQRARERDRASRSDVVHVHERYVCAPQSQKGDEAVQDYLSAPNAGASDVVKC
jgi:hypothetical protein